MMISALIAELSRERNIRVYVFPRLVKQGRVTEAEASLRLAQIDETIGLLRSLCEAGLPTTHAVQARLGQRPALNKESEYSTTSHNIKGTV